MSTVHDVLRELQAAGGIKSCCAAAGRRLGGLTKSSLSLMLVRIRFFDVSGRYLVNTIGGGCVTPPVALIDHHPS